jgi:predicted ATPase/transcriptional regulator with XRE-family HTH domain/Tfp pilus assembly protein PilF
MTEVVDNLFSFGIWVRRRRKALDLTQAALAHQVGCAEVTIRKLEADAFRPSREIADRLASCLDIPPDHRDLFVQIARAERSVDRLPSPLTAMNQDDALANVGRGGGAVVAKRSKPPISQRAETRVLPLHNLPAPTTSLIGRERELTEVCSRFTHTDVRLLTFTGPGGIGKTRLALAMAVEIAQHFTDGVFFVSVAAVTDPLLVPSTIAQVLGVQETADQPLIEGLKSYVRRRKMLLILDNFEQVLPAAPIVSALLAAAPGLKVLITSRSLLHVYGECHFPVPSLAYPNLAGTLPREHIECESIRLFMDRARSIKPDYPFTEATISTIAQICRRLDGLPLAIELAAARIRLFSPSGILSRLEQGLPFLKGGAVDTDARHQTLENTIAWSYQLLEPSERTLFRRMAAFVGGCTLEAVISVCDLDDTQDLVDGIQALLDKSLLKEEITASGEPRFSMLETIRQFALKQLTLSGESEILGPRHAEYYQALAEQAEPKLLGKESIPWLDQLDTEYGNIRATLAWFKAEPQRAEAGLRLAGTLCRFWSMRGQFTEGRDWIDAMSAHSKHFPTAVRAKALDGAGVLTRNQGDYCRAKLLHEQSLALWQALGNTLGIARSHLHLGLVAHNMGDFLNAKLHFDTALATFEDQEPASEEEGEVFIQALNALGKVFRGQSNFDQACGYFERALTLSQRIGNRRNEAQILNNLGGMKNSLRQYRVAQVYLKRALEIERALRDLPGEAITLYNLAVAEQETYQYGDAQEHFLAALKVHETTGNRWEQINVKLGLGILYHQIGDLMEAQTYLQRALVLSDEIGDEVGRAFVLANLGPVLRDMEVISKAEQVLQEGLALSQTLNDKATMSYCLSSLGMVALDADQALQAVDYALQALTLRREIGIPAWTTTDLATLAVAHLALDQPDQAVAYANETLKLLAEVRADEPEFPHRDYFMCYQVYAALAQPDQAHRSLQSAYKIVLTRASKIRDSALRQSFLTCVPINDAIVQAAERMLLPPNTRRSINSTT